MAGISQKKIILLDINYPNYRTEREILAPFQVDIKDIQTNENRKIILDSVKNADAVMVREVKIDSKIINNMKKCKIIVRYGIGVDNIDLEAAARKKIFVANVPNYGTEEVSDHALALLLAVSRRIVKRDKDIRKGVWGVGADEPIYSFKGKILGIIGFGRVGKAFYHKAKNLGFKELLIYDPYFGNKYNYFEKVISVDIKKLCSHSDVISLHAPLTTENFHLIDESSLSLMKKNVIIINTARGGLIDEEALVKYLKEKKIFGAGLDVFEKEPPDRYNPLFELDNVVVTDHTAWYSEESLNELQKKAAQEVKRVFSGGKPQSWINSWEDENETQK